MEPIYNTTQVASLEDHCLRYVVARLPLFSAEQMSRVPYRLRYSMLQSLPLVDFWKLEDLIAERVAVDMRRFWEQFTQHHDVSPIGLDFVHLYCENPPMGKAVFNNSPDKREICFQRLWSDLEALRHERKPKHVLSVQSLLFSPNHDPYGRRFTELVPDELKLESDSEEALTRCAVRAFMAEAIKVVSRGRPQYLRHNGIMQYLKPALLKPRLDPLVVQTKTETILKQLLSNIVAVNTPCEEMEEEWFETLLSNGMPTLKLCVRYDLFQYVMSGVRKCAERKKLDELIIRIRDEVTPIFDISRFITDIMLSHFRHLRLLDMNSLHHPRLARQATMLTKFASTLQWFMQQPQFSCLRLSGVISTTVGKSLIFTFLSTPCSSAQRLEIGSMYVDPDVVNEKEHRLPVDNDYYTHKHLFVDSIRMEHAKTLNMNKYWVNVDAIEQYYFPNTENRFTKSGSLTSWLLGLPHLKIGSLEIYDYGSNCVNTAVRGRVCIEALKMFIVVKSEEKCIWTTPLFTGLMGHPTLHVCLWDLRILKPSDTENCRLKALSDVLLKHLPSGNLRILSITINKNIEPSAVEQVEQTMSSVHELAFSIETNSFVQERHL